MSSQLYPEVIDASSLIALPASPIYLPIGIEGQMDNDGTATVGNLYPISTISEAIVLFGAAASLTKIISAVIRRGSSPVLAAASKKGSAPVLADRQAVWDNLSSDKTVRVRLTDSTTQADLVALADSCEEADLIFNKQFCLVGMAASTTKANLLTAATAIASTRGILVAPAVYDQDGVLQSGSFAAACVAAEVSKNSNPANDLDLLSLVFLTAIEKDALGYPLFREKVVAGVAVNDFEDLLQGNVSPLQSSLTPGGVEITHLRTTLDGDTYDALSTRIIVDQIFVDVRDYLNAMGFLHQGNTESTRARIVSGVENLLLQRQDWISPIVQGNGTLGYNVSAVSSNNGRQIIVGYGGAVVRGVQTIKVVGNLTIST